MTSAIWRNLMTSPDDVGVMTSAMTSTGDPATRGSILVETSVGA